MDMNFVNIKLNSEITKSVLRHATIDTSSDLIYVMAEIFKKTLEYPPNMMSPILELEEPNWREGFANVRYMESQLDNLSYADCVDAEHAYQFIIGILLEDENYSKRFRLDEKDHEGWAIYKELCEKRAYCRRVAAIKSSELKKD